MLYDLFVHFAKIIDSPIGFPELVWKCASKNDFGTKTTNYTLGACYMEIFIGLGSLQATAYRATPTVFQTLDQEDKLLKESEEIIFDHANVALWCIGKYDPIISKYLKRLHKKNETTFLKFLLDEAQLDLFRSFKLNRD